MTCVAQPRRSFLWELRDKLLIHSESSFLNVFCIKASRDAKRTDEKGQIVFTYEVIILRRRIWSKIKKKINPDICIKLSRFVKYYSKVCFPKYVLFIICDVTNDEINYINI